MYLLGIFFVGGFVAVVSIYSMGMVCAGSTQNKPTGPMLIVITEHVTHFNGVGL